MQDIVLYVINNSDVNESMSLELVSNELDPQYLSLESQYHLLDQHHLSIQEL